MPQASPPSTAPADPEADHAYFFLGNCQMQYLCSVIGSVSTAPRYLLGHPFNVNVTLDGAPVPYVRGKGFQAGAREMLAKGGRTILLVQQTSRGRYQDRIAGWKGLFTDVLPVPHLNYRSIWPGHALEKPIADISDHSIRRLADWEQHEFLGKLKSCGVDDRAFADAFWARCREEVRFFHPGHPSGDVFAETLQALGPDFAARLPCFDALVAALGRTMGIYQTCSHPIHPRAAEIHGISWAKTEFYKVWTGLKQPDPAHLRPFVDRATELLDSPETMAGEKWPMQAHFRAAVGAANLKLERRNRALRQLQQAAVELKGFHPILRVALNQAGRARRFKLVEAMLVEVAPYVIGFRPEGAGITGALEALAADAEGRAALRRVQDRVAPDTWMHATIQGLADAAA